jgi:hypothetical protein
MFQIHKQTIADQECNPRKHCESQINDQTRSLVGADGKLAKAFPALTLTQARIRKGAEGLLPLQTH